MKKIQDIIAERRAVFPRQYNQEEITHEEIETILKAANWAPTHKRTEPWRFKVLHTEQKRKELGAFLSERYEATAKKFSKRKQQGMKEKVEKSACVILICMQRDLKERIPEWEEVASTAMAVQNMWLTATQLKIGSYWSSPALIDEIGKFIKLEEGETCLGIFYMGKYDGDLMEGRREDWKEKVSWIE